MGQRAVFEAVLQWLKLGDQGRVEAAFLQVVPVVAGKSPGLVVFDEAAIVGGFRRWFGARGRAGDFFGRRRGRLCGRWGGGFVFVVVVCKVVGG